MSLEKKTVLITGASAGVGAETARLFARRGANVILLARKPGPLEALASEINEFGEAVAFPLDVTDDSAVAAMLERVIQQFGQLHVVVNNAGFNCRGHLHKISLVDLATIVDVNLKAPILLTRQVMPYLRKADRAAIVNVASLAGRVAVPEEATYCATKFGLRGFTFALAEELRGTNVTASVVSPGPIDTGFIMSDLDHVPDLVFSIRMSTAQRVASLVLKCAEDGLAERVIPSSARYMTLLGYLWPTLARATRPLMQWKGRRAKDRIRRDSAAVA